MGQSMQSLARLPSESLHDFIVRVKQTSSYHLNAKKHRSQQKRLKLREKRLQNKEKYSNKLKKNEKIKLSIDCAFKNKKNLKIESMQKQINRGLVKQMIGHQLICINLAINCLAKRKRKKISMLMD